MPAPRATKAVITNAIEAAKACGIVVGVIEVAKDGTVKIIAESVAQGYQGKEPTHEW